MAKAAKSNKSQQPVVPPLPEKETPSHKLKSSVSPSIYDPGKYKIIETPADLAVSKRGDPYFYKHYPFEKLAIGQSITIPLLDEHGKEDPNATMKSIEKGLRQFKKQPSNQKRQLLIRPWQDEKDSNVQLGWYVSRQTDLK